jgi:periplasmic protein CpxP/Spy
MSKQRQLWILAFALMVAVACLPAIAQDKPDQSSQPAATSQGSDQGTVDPATKAKVQEGLQKLATQLQLTDDQKAKIKPLLQEQYTQLKSVHDDTSLSDEQKKAKMKAIHQDYHSQIQAVLTPEQQKKYAAMKEQKMKEMDQK